MTRPERYGRSTIHYRDASGILTKPSGFIKAFDYTLNPYSGCAFGCNYCYAAFFAPDNALVDQWGDWVRVKENAVDLLRRKRSGSIQGKSIYMSSVTDPYQPIERELELTRAILEVLLPHQPRLVIQTRGTLVTRDIDLLTQFEALRVNMTITTDDDAVRRAFEPRCASSQQRMGAVRTLVDAGIDVCITMSPLLPVRDPTAFSDALIASGAKRFVVQDFHIGQTRFVAGTGETAMRLAEEMGWNTQRYREITRIMADRLPDLRYGQDGFVPNWDEFQRA
jgi:DNA repair photolyase